MVPKTLLWACQFLIHTPPDVLQKAQDDEGSKKKKKKKHVTCDFSNR